MTTNDRREARRRFESLPYAGNHCEVGGADHLGNQRATFDDGEGNRWEFEHDATWDNVEPTKLNGVPL